MHMNLDHCFLPHDAEEAPIGPAAGSPAAAISSGRYVASLTGTSGMARL